MKRRTPKCAGGDTLLGSPRVRGVSPNSVLHGGPTRSSCFHANSYLPVLVASRPCHETYTTSLVWRAIFPAKCRATLRIRIRTCVCAHPKICHEVSKCKEWMHRSPFGLKFQVREKCVTPPKLPDLHPYSFGISFLRKKKLSPIPAICIWETGVGRNPWAPSRLS